MTSAPTAPPQAASTLPIARFRIRARALVPVHLPHYAGSMLRGAWGAALRHLACMTGAPQCAGCPLRTTCPYLALFETPAPPPGSHALQDFSAVPNPYVIEPPQAATRCIETGQELRFAVVLVGHALEQRALVFEAMRRALARGLGPLPQRSALELLAIDHLAMPLSGPMNSPVDSPIGSPVSSPFADPSSDPEGAHAHPVWPTPNPHTDAARFAIDLQSLCARPTGATTQNEPQTAGPISLHIHTPLRLQQQGHALGVSALSPDRLIATLARRIALLMQFHAPQTPVPATLRPSDTGPCDWGAAARAAAHLGHSLPHRKALHWMDWTRYSARQQREMTLGGVMGEWQLWPSSDAPHALNALRPWLAVGQWTHVGKNATFGLGSYHLSN